ncbi:MAG: hypothetical protein LBE62_11045 [Azonexus sp.]|jgi:hypothetical protein|nr:hypothetical protein [Azonexus sp.]
MKPHFKYSIYSAIALAILLAPIPIFWLKAEHTPTAAIQAAESFLKLRDARQFAQAFDLTVKQGYVGLTPDELRAISDRECKATKFMRTHPHQSNGNRLRRLIFGREIDMPEVHVEFVNSPCLLRVTVRKTETNTWRVFYFAGHAG